MRALISPLSRLNQALSRVALALGALGLIVMTGITGWQVFGRYVLNDSPQWVERTTLLLVLYFTFLAGAVGVREESHLGISFISDALPVRVRKAVGVIVYAILAGFGGVLAWYGVELVDRNLGRFHADHPHPGGRHVSRDAGRWRDDRAVRGRVRAACMADERLD